MGHAAAAPRQGRAGPLMAWLPKGYAVVGQNASGAMVYLVAMVRTAKDADAKLAQARTESETRWPHLKQPGFPRFAILDFKMIDVTRGGDERG